VRNRWHRTATDEAVRLGLTHTRVNARGFDVWESPAGAEYAISPGIDEARCRDLVRRMRRDAGITDRTPGRNPAKVKARQARDRKRLAQAKAKHEARLAHLRGAWHKLTDSERDEVHAIEARLAELRDLERQMQCIPNGPEAIQ
jgi:hypothetical protein